MILKCIHITPVDSLVLHVWAVLTATVPSTSGIILNVKRTANDVNSELGSGPRVGNGVSIFTFTYRRIAGGGSNVGEGSAGNMVTLRGRGVMLQNTTVRRSVAAGWHIGCMYKTSSDINTR